MALAFVLAATLAAAVAGPVGAGLASVYGSPITMAPGGTSAAAGALMFSESTVNEFGGGAFTLTVSIADSAGVGSLEFVQTSPPTLSKPDSLQATVAWSGANSFTVTATSSSTTVVESFVVGNLRVKAASSAAAGAIKTTYTSTLPPGTFGTKFTASGTLSAGTVANVTTVLSVTMDSGSAQFAATGPLVGNLYINTGGNTAENWAVNSATSTSVTLAHAVSFNHAIGERVKQDQTIGNQLPSIGTVGGAPATLSIVSGVITQVARGVADQPAASVTFAELSGHPLALNQVIHFAVSPDATLGAPAATFSATPTVTANTLTTGLVAAIQNVTTTGFDVKVTTAASGLTGGSMSIGNIRLTVASTATLGPLSLAITSSGVGVPITVAQQVATVVGAPAPTLTLTPSASAVPVNGKAALHAQLSLAVAGLPITFQAKPAGAVAFTTIGTVNTSATGSADFVVAVPVTTTYQAVFAGNISYAAATSPAVAVAALRSLTLQIAGGYKNNLTTGYSSAVSVKNGTYVTLRGVLGSPNNADVAVKFYQRIGKTAPWTFLSTGRTDASGVVVWSKVVKVASGATGYDRYVYFKVIVDATVYFGQTVSNGVHAVAR